MQTYPPDKIRNIVLLSHGGAGKTSLAEAMLFDAGAVNRLGKVDDGTTTSDWDPDEQKRKISTNTSVLPLEWKGHKINLLDAPGYADFVGEMKSGASVADAAVIVVCAASGVEVGTELVWRYADEVDLPRLILMNKMDRENADFFRSLEQVQGTFGKRCVAFQLPIGAVSTFKGIVDLIAQKAYLGPEGTEAEIPADLQAVVADHREKLVEAVAETDDDLIAKYLEGEEIPEDELRRALHTALAQGKIVPVLAGSGLQNVAIRPFMDAVISLVPAPAERTARMKDGKELKADPAGPLAAFVFKSTADPYVGKLTYFKVLSGTLKSDSQVWNPVKDKAERVGQVMVLRGKNQEPAQQVSAGDIGAVAKLADTTTSDTLTTREQPLVLPPIAFPKPVYRAAVHPKTKADLDKMSLAISRIVEEDPTLRYTRDPETNETLVTGLGDTQIDVALGKIRRKFGTDLKARLPRVAYKETITRVTQTEYRHKKQSGGHGQYGHVLLRLEPLERTQGFEFANEVVGGRVPREYVPAVEKGILKALDEGSLAGFPLVDLRAILYDGSYHDVDSSGMSFEIASAAALRKGVSEASPVLLEPIMKLTVTVPDAYTGEVISDLNVKRGRILGMAPHGGHTAIEADVPLAEVQRYAQDLRSLSQGRGVYQLEFDHYEQVPPSIEAKVISEAKRQREAERV